MGLIVLVLLLIPGCFPIVPHWEKGGCPIYLYICNAPLTQLSNILPLYPHRCLTAEELRYVHDVSFSGLRCRPGAASCRFPA